MVLLQCGGGEAGDTASAAAAAEGIRQAVDFLKDGRWLVDTTASCSHTHTHNTPSKWRRSTPLTLTLRVTQSIWSNHKKM